MAKFLKSTEAIEKSTSSNLVNILSMLVCLVSALTILVIRLIIRFKNVSQSQVSCQSFRLISDYGKRPEVVIGCVSMEPYPVGLAQTAAVSRCAVRSSLSFYLAKFTYPYPAAPGKFLGYRHFVENRVFT